MAIPGYTVSFADIQNEYGGNDPIAINEYYRDTSNGLNTRYVVNKQINSDHPNTLSIPSSGQIDLASFRNTTCLLGFNRYYCSSCGNLNGNPTSLHFYTSNPYNTVPPGEQITQNNYQIEFANYFYIFSSAFIPGTTALWRFFSPGPANGAGGSGGHLFTTDKSEGNNAGITEEGIVGYVRTYQTPNSEPVYRGFLNGDWFYTFYPGEFNNGGYNNEGIKFYAYENTNWRA